MEAAAWALPPHGDRKPSVTFRKMTEGLRWRSPTTGGVRRTGARKSEHARLRGFVMADDVEHRAAGAVDPSRIDVEGLGEPAGRER